jgi:hypothetical protein
MNRANFFDSAWRHAYVWLLIAFAIFPIYVVIVSSFDPTGGLDELTMGDFNQRATNIELIMKVVPDIALGQVGHGRFRELNRLRNIVAHAHFDQDRYEGDFKLVRRKHRSHKIEQFADINAKSVNDAAAELEGIAKHMEAVHDFFDIRIPGQFGFKEPCDNKAGHIPN